MPVRPDVDMPKKMSRIRRVRCVSLGMKKAEFAPYSDRPEIMHRMDDKKMILPKNRWLAKRNVSAVIGELTSLTLACTVVELANLF